MSRLIAVAALCTALGLGTWLGSGSAAGGAERPPKTFVAHLGDEVRVPDTPIACRVVRVRELGRRVGLDCRRGGPLSGTYGTLLTAREAAVVRFESARVAKVISVATHDGEPRTCR